MTDYISRQAAIGAVGDTDLLTKEEAFWAVECIKEVPTADVVEVVRCKDCKHDHKCNKNIIRDSIGGGYIYCPVDYCSYGERIEQ